LKGKIFDIKKFAIHDGPGIRTTIFMLGCPLSCWWCHNPESIRKDPVPEPGSNSEDNFESACSSLIDPLVKAWTVDELMREIQKDNIFFEESGGGVTFSGGEPMLQHRFLKEVLKECRDQGIHTAVDTSGYLPYPHFDKINEFVDLYLYDLKIIDEAEHIKYTGVSNKLIIDNMKKLLSDEKELNIRVPLIPGVTDTEKNLSMLAELIEPYTGSVSIHFLPYNKFAESKYGRFNEKPKLGKLNTQSDEELSKIKNDFMKKGFEVSLRG
jgi:pyruvate formate lyase activating enzyme